MVGLWDFEDGSDGRVKAVVSRGVLSRGPGSGDVGACLGFSACVYVEWTAVWTWGSYFVSELELYLWLSMRE